MHIRRTFAPLALAIAPALLTHCFTETPADDTGGGGSSNAGTGTTGGASGAAGSTTAGGGVAGTASGSGGAIGGAGAGTSGTSGMSGANAGGAAGSSGGAGAASGTGGMAGTGGSSAGAGGANGGRGGSGGSGGSSAAGGTGGGGAFVLTSSKISTDMEMPAEFTCASTVAPVSPPLAWSGAPPGTMSFAMVFVDTTIINANMTDARGYHSAIWDIPPSTMALPENIPTGATITTPVMAKQFSPIGAKYLGPCPNNGTAPADTYEFRLFALPVATLTGQLTSVRGILQAITAAGPLGTAVLRARSDATGTLR